jgi:FtsP/CotA-like multicopper oxidase with cupredoxin domain
MSTVTVSLQLLVFKVTIPLLFLRKIGSRVMNINFKLFSKRAIAIGTIIAIAMIINPFLIHNDFYLSAANSTPIPHYFGPYPNYATSQLPTVTRDAAGNVISITGGIKKFVDSLPLLGPAGANNLGQYLPIAIPDKTSYPGSDYYEIALVEYYQKMHSDLAPTKLRGYVQLDTAVIPGAGVPLTNLDAANPTPITLPNGSQAIGVDIPRYLGPVIIAEKDTPVRIKFYNLLPTGAGGDLFLPVDTTVMGAGMGPTPMLDSNGMPMHNPDGSIMYESYTQNRATLHLHGGRTPWISDGTPHQWITPAGENTAYPKGVSVYNVPDMPDPGDGAMTFYYTNQQSARLMFYHDHAYGITRLNVYAGEAAAYILRDQVEQALISSGIIPVDEIPLVIQDKTFVPDNTTPVTNFYGTFPSQLAFQDPTWDISKWGGPGSLWYPHVYVPMQNPDDPSGMNIIGRWHYGPWFWPPTAVTHGPVPNPYYVGGALYDPTYPYNSMEPPLIPGVPSISMPGEAFMDTPVVNGVAYPYLEVEPKAYRFRILNAADDRFFNLQLYKASTGIVTHIAVTNGGSGYTTEPSVTISGTGVGATARAIIDQGAVTAIELLTVGSGYTVPPTVTISPPPLGTQATATAQIYTAPTEVGMVPATRTSGYPASWPIDGREGGVPDPATRGPSFIQIGTEGGFLPNPVVLPNQPVDWNVDVGTFDAGNINKGTLQLGTAERADVIVDFSQFAGQTLILYNDNPAPSPASDPRQDYYTCRPDMTEVGGCDEIMPGYGSNTRTIMQIRVANTTPAAPFDLSALLSAFISTATTEGVFAASQNDIIVPQAAYSSAYNTTFSNKYSRIFDNSLTFTPIGQTSPVTIEFEPKMIQDEMGEAYDPEYGRMAVLLGTELRRTTAGQQTMLLYGFAEPPTEVIKSSIAGTQIGTLADGTQIWKITHNGVDVHTVHWHMFEVQLINRVAWDNNIREPLPNELGWKETIRVNPLQDTIVALRPIVPDVPFDLPNSIRPIDPTMPLGVTLKNTFDIAGQPVTLTNHLINYGWEYVWHCHILAHEEMDMMRSITMAAPPMAPYGLTVTLLDGNPTYRLSWIDNSLSETNFTIQRSTGNALTWTTLATIPSRSDNNIC